MACRVFIGLPEAAFYPGAVYLLSRWYTKKVWNIQHYLWQDGLLEIHQELALRTAILYLGVMVSLAFGNVRASILLVTWYLVLIGPD